MSDSVIKVENLGKRYQLGRHTSSGARYRTLRDTLAEGAQQIFRRRDNRNGKTEEFWALRDVNFEVKQGEVVGIIGRNGAGKSTLLKVLSRITEPTTGRITIQGRVASLLEVGTGFHPELTGRENIFLNGAVLGMSRVEIKAKFDEIVAFAEVEKFLDTPVKRYSSGMYVRLAFAVAAHLEPETLIVDEVLAVGDAEFQKKCLGKMDEVAQAGRTVLFVSHNLAAMRMICRSGIMLHKGEIVRTGSINEVCDAYSHATAVGARLESTVNFERPSEQCDIWMTSATLLRNGEPAVNFQYGDEISLHVRFQAATTIEKPIFGWMLQSADDANAVAANNHFLPSPRYSPPLSSGTIICHLGKIPLMANHYSFNFWLCRNPHDQHHVRNVLSFQVEERDIWGTSQLPPAGLSLLWWPCQFEFAS
jgi:lipopolysaccharide transport system ATP-binding protein